MWWVLGEHIIPLVPPTAVYTATVLDLHKEWGRQFEESLLKW